jgi:penicillin-binding protein 2
MNKNRQEQTLLVILSLLWLIFVLRLFYIQGLKGAMYRTTSTEIRARLIPSAAPRGIIYDRYGQIIASNKPAYAIYIMPSELKKRNTTLQRLSRLIDMPLSEIEGKLAATKYPFEPVLIRDYAPFRLVALIEENAEYLPGVSIATKTIRYYPFGAVGAHVLGHVGEISREELFKERGSGIRLGDIVGLSGIEKVYDRYLRGIGGGQHIEVDAQGRPVKRTQALISIPGKEVYLTLDMEFQKAVEKRMADYNGAVIVLDIQSGEVLALVSKPGFDPNLFAKAISHKEWQRLLKEEKNPFHNRALTAFPPGSTFKVVTALAALEEKLVASAKQFFCQGYIQIGRRTFNDWKPHGQISFFDAIVQSCDVVFYNMGLQLGPNVINRYATSLGLGTPTGIDLPQEASGLIPYEEWKKERYGLDWYPGDSMNTAIGQGFVQVTPMQMSVLIAGIASSRNSLPRPFLCKKIVEQDNSILLANQPYELSQLSFSRKNMDTLRQALADVVKAGTGRAAWNEEIAIAGKTGTAEDPPRKYPHAWFIGYAPVNDPRIAIVVFLESGGHGGDTAVPAARDMIMWWNKHRNK